MTTREPCGPIWPRRTKRSANTVVAPRKNKSAGWTVQKVCNYFLHLKKVKVDAGEIQLASWKEYKRTCLMIKRVLGAATLAHDVEPEDFLRLRAKLARRFGYYRMTNPESSEGVCAKIATNSKPSGFSGVLWVYIPTQGPAARRISSEGEYTETSESSQAADRATIGRRPCLRRQAGIHGGESPL
jgi:hypothetical protein